MMAGVVEPISPQAKRRQNFEYLRAQLETERASFMSHWRELGEFVLPRRPRFMVSDANRGDRRNGKIIDNTATLAARTLRSGMMGGVTSPARPWFRLTTDDTNLAEVFAVKRWLQDVTERMQSVFLRSNLYNALPLVYGDMGTFATAAMLTEEDFEKTLRCSVIPVGSYCIALNAKGQVNTFFRVFRMTVREVVEKFCEKKPDGNYDFSNVSKTVMNLYANGNTQSWIDVCHFIVPNDNYDEKKLKSKYKKFLSVYYERGIGSSNEYNDAALEGKFLREAGYDFFPVLCPRWEVTGEDVYGTSCPGMEALGDIKMLQTMEKRALQAVGKKVNPPMVGPTALKQSKSTIVEGETTFLDERDGVKGFRPAHEVDLNIRDLEFKQDQTRNRIQRAFFEDLFLMLISDDRNERPTAEEVRAQKEEKLLAIGPVLEQLNQDLLNPLIDITFDIMLRQGQIPEPPEELAGQSLKVEYISIMAAAQKMVGLSSMERFTGFVLNMYEATGGNADVLDNWNMDETIEQYGESSGVSPRIIRSPEEVAAIRQQRRAAQAKAQQLANAELASKSAKNLSQADMGGDNALTRLTEQSNAGQVVPQP